MFKHGFPPEWSTLKKLIWLVGSGIVGAASGIWKTVTGALIHITNALASPVQALSVAIEPQQSGSGDPSPDNVRPITGWTECNIQQSNKNILEVAMQSGSQNGITYTVNPDGTIITNGTASKTQDRSIYSKWPIEFLKGQNAYISGLPNGASDSTFRIMLYYHDKNSQDISSQNIYSNSSLLDIPSNAADASITIHFQKNYVANNLVFAPQIEIGQTTVYETHQGTTYSISWQTEAGTVYGGTLDVVNGTLTVTKAAKTFDENDDWGITGSVFFINRSLTDFLIGDTYHLPYFICNKYKFQKYVSVSSNAKDDGVYTNAHNTFGKRIFVRDSNYSTVDAFKASLENSPLVVCCELVEPITYTLTPQQISTLAGENNIWADVNGEITITYLAEAE